jgi:HEPN domain-containing protein
MNDKQTIVESWLTKADHDLTTAHLVQNHLPDFKDTITFHCQQAVEKLLKSYLIYLNITFRRSHDLIYLLDIIEQPELFTREDYDRVARLQDYAVEIRYPNESIFLSNEEILDALTTADDLFMRVSGLLRKS